MRTSPWLFLACFVPLGCGHDAKDPARTQAATTTEVATVAPARKTLHYTVEQPGRIEPFEQTPIYARISGYVRAVHAEIGDRIKRGQVLIEADVPELAEEHHRKEAQVEQARVGIAQAEQAVRVAEASRALARANIQIARAALAKAVAVQERWRSESQRMERLVKDKVVDRQSGDEVHNQSQGAESARAEADARILAAEAALQEAQARCDKAMADRDAAGNQLLVAQADERQLKAMLSFASIAAPYDGVVSGRTVHTGHLLQVTAGASRGEPLLVVQRMDKVRVFVEVPETDAILVREGSPGRVRVQVLNDREFVGKVAGTSWSLDPSQRTLRTEIDLSNSEGLLRPGMYVHALIDVERPNAWVIPAGAVLIRDGLSFCYVVKDGRTRRLPVRTGLRGGDVVEILKVQAPPAHPGEAPAWVDPTGAEAIVVTKPGELIDNQAVKVTSP